jgi:integrase
MRETFTKRMLDGLRPKKARYQVMDETVRGLALTVYPSGERVFSHVRKIDGRLERHTMGTYGDGWTLELARGRASERNGAVARWRANDCVGASPLRRAVDVKTLDGVLEEYVRVRIPKANKPDLAEKRVRALAKYLPFGGRNLAAISRDDVKAAHRDISKSRGNVTANRAVELLKRLFFFAQVEEMFTGANPALRIELNEEKSRKRYIKPAEMPGFLIALDRETNINLRDAVTLALATLARMGDIQSMRWDDMDLEAETWVCPNEKKKNAYVVPLTSQALEVLRRRKQEGLSATFVFPSHRPAGHVDTFLHAFTRFTKRAGLDAPPEKDGSPSKNNLHLHDLRRTTSSWATARNVSGFLIAGMLGHKISGVTGIYSQASTDAIRAALQPTCDAIFQSKGKIAVLPARQAS